MLIFVHIYFSLFDLMIDIQLDNAYEKGTHVSIRMYGVTV
jgi:hypothetical protein